MDAVRHNIVQPRYNQKSNKHITKSASLPIYLQPASMYLRMKGDVMSNEATVMIVSSRILRWLTVVLTRR